MATCYKNFPVEITYEDASTEQIYALSLSLGESVNIEHSASLGVKGSTAVFNRGAAQGSISVESYMDESLVKTLELLGNNYQGLTIKFGPYETPAPCVLSSLSVNMTLGEPLVLSREYLYYGSVITGSTPPSVTRQINPVVPEGISLSGYDAISGSNIITDVSWGLSQNYEEFNLLGDTTPVMVYSNGEKTMDINGEALTESLMTTPSAGCVVPPKAYAISLSGCGKDLGTLHITGYMTSRASNVTPGEVENNVVSIIEYL